MVEIGLMVLYMNLISLQTDRRTDKQKEDGQEWGGGLTLKNRRDHKRDEGGGGEFEESSLSVQYIALFNMYMIYTTFHLNTQ